MKIPCIVITYFDTEIIQKSLEFLIQEPRLQLTVIENPSETTTVNQVYALDLLKSGQIVEYILMDKNISNNAVEMILENKIDSFKKSPYLLITDGDLVVNEPNWLDEKIRIMEENSDVFVCGSQLKLDNLPTKVFPNAAKEWLSPIIEEHPLYLYQFTGIWLCLFRTPDFLQYFKYMRKKRHRFLDSNMHNYCYLKLKKKWASTKKCLAWHLTWDRYNDPEHSYSKMKFSQPMEKIWNHGQFCGYTINTYSNGQLLQHKETRHCFSKYFHAYCHYNYILNMLESNTRSVRRVLRSRVKKLLIFSGLWWR